jgi:hopanoid biosynthesis associated protein HpnK
LSLDRLDAAWPKRVITVADDFGLSLAVNEAVERAASSGILTTASLMVAGPAAADAVARARRIAGLRVGLHLVVIEGVPVLPAAEIPDLVDAQGKFPADQLRLGINYFFRPHVRRQLAAEIRAQFAAFRATGLILDHANAHKHMHLHPTVGRMMMQIGREFGLRAVRVPYEPRVAGGPADTLGSRAMRHWCAILRGQARRAGLLTNDWIFGLGWTGHMTPDRTQSLLENLPPGLTEIYFHPATGRDATLRRLMPEYEHEAEFAALMQTQPPPDLRLTSYSDLAAPLPTLLPGK